MAVLRWHKKALFLFGAGIILLWYIVSSFLSDMSCSREESINILDGLCQDYQEGLIAGSLCPDLCDKNSVIFQKCLNYKEGKKIFILSWKGETIVLKSKEAHWSTLTKDLGNHIPTALEFMKMVKDSIGLTLDIKIKEFPKLDQQDLAVLSSLWSMDFKKFTTFSNPENELDKKKLQTAERSLWSLLQQNEYAMLKFLRNRAHIPNVLGSCGNYYAVEFLPPGEIFQPEVIEMTGLKEKTAWRERVEVAVSLLEAIKSYDEEFHQTLHLCDVKMENFGISKNGAVKVLDLDMTYFTSRLKKLLQDNVCGSHTDCNFFDCEGFCDQITGQCTKYRTNNNLQIICKRILLNNISNKYLGLLRNPPPDLDDQLTPLLIQCASPKIRGDPFTTNHAPVRLLDRIYNILQREVIAYRNRM